MDIRSLKSKGRKNEERSKDYRSCEPTHDPVQQEAPHQFSGVDGQASRQNLLRSRGELPRIIDDQVSTK
jgi:hypothetical protein